MYCHDLEVMTSNPGLVELWMHSTSILSRTSAKVYIYIYICLSPKQGLEKKRFHGDMTNLTVVGVDTNPSVNMGIFVNKRYFD